MAFLLASSRLAGIDENAVSIAMSFASAKLTFINCNSSSILSKVRSDKTLSESVLGCDGRCRARPMQPRSHHICRLPVKYSSSYVCFHLKRTFSGSGLRGCFRPEAVIRQARKTRREAGLFMPTYFLRSVLLFAAFNRASCSLVLDDRSDAYVDPTVLSTSFGRVVRGNRLILTSRNRNQLLWRQALRLQQPDHTGRPRARHFPV